MNIDVEVGKRLGDFHIQARFGGASGITVLFGHSGAGKTSVVNMIAGLLRPDAGRIVVGERVLFDAAARVDVSADRRRIGYVFQEGRLFPHLSVSQNLVYGWKRTPVADRYVNFAQVVSLLALEPLLARRPAKLSGGEKQRVALGRALLTSPLLLLMDEPLSSLDTDRKLEVLPYIERLRDEFRLPIIYVSHAMEEVVRLATTLVLLSEGHVVAAGPVEELMGRIDLFPVTGHYEAGAVVAVRVTGHVENYALSLLEFDGGELQVPRVNVPAGASMRVRIRARDVSIATRRPEGLSIRNVIAGRISAINAPRTSGADANAYAEVQIMAGATALVARVTRQAVDELALVPGRQVYALVKSVAIDRQSLGLPARG